MTRRVVGWAVAVVVLISYDTWVWLVPVNGHPEIIDGYLSELSASNQPNNLFFRLGDGLTAVCVAGIGIVAARHWPVGAARRGQGGTSGRWWRAAAGFLLVFAVATGLDAISVMDCSPTLSAACAVAEKAGQLSWAHYLHTITSVTAQVGIMGSMIAACLAERPPYLITRRRWLWLLAGAETVALTIMMIMLVVGEPGLGYPQAIMVLLAAVWFAVAAVDVSRPEP